MSDYNMPTQPIADILIVDDVSANLKVLGGMLKEDGYKIRPVLSGEVAIQVALKEKPDLILLDIMMPVMDGYEVCRKIKSIPELQNIPVVFISALNDTKDIVKAFECGGIDYITKPFQAAEVSARVATHLKICSQNNELRKLNATKDKFFSIIAHDLRGPISNMLSISEVISEKGQVDEDTLYSFLQMQKDLSKETIQLLENLLLWAKSSTNKIDFEPVLMDLSTVADECIKGARIQAKNKSITISSSMSVPNQIVADENMIRLIIRNLLSNAIKFTPKGGNILLSINSNSNSSTVLSVKDNGIGIPSEIMKNLFRIDENSKRFGTDGEASNGLGLLLCNEFVTKHKGHIWVESTVDEGSTFSFSIPTP